MISHSKSFITTNHINKVVDCLNSGLTAAGNLNTLFSKKFGRFIERDHVMLFSSGTSALYHLLKNLECHGRSEVLLPNYICSNVYDAIVLSGNRPVLYDNAPGEWITELNLVKGKVTPETCAIVLNHTFGQALPFVKQLKEEFPNVFIIEDCCHLIAPQSRVNNVEISVGDASFFSFNSTKLLAGGEGGALQINDSTIFRSIESTRIDLGLSDMTCALLIEQLKDYPSFLNRRKEIAEKYSNELVLNSHQLLDQSTYFRYTTMVQNQEEILVDREVAFRKGVDQLIHLKMNLDTHLPNSVHAYEQTVSLPIYPALTEKELKTIIERFNSYYDN